MANTSFIPGLPEGLSSTTQQAREKLHAALIILDDMAASSSEPTPIAHQPVCESDVRWILKARRNRSKIFPADLFADPAWDMLLELYAAELGQRRLSVTNLCDGAGVPATTALRWLATLEKNELVDRLHDPLDRRRVFVTLSASGSEAMRSYFASNPPSQS
jgi:DNA-binding MarR family transcriptional regulator